MPVCLNVYHICSWCARRPRRGHWGHWNWMELPEVVSYQVGAKNQSQAFPKSSHCSLCLSSPQPLLCLASNLYFV